MLDAEKPGEGLAPSHRPRVSSGEQQEYLEDNTAKGFDQASPPPRDRGRGMSTIEHAMELARNYIPVFPCRPDKSPYTDHGFKDASTDLRMVRRLFGPRPDALIGVPTGHRFDVLDIDVKHFEPVEWLKACEPEIPRTRTHRTRSGGLHYLFKPSRRFRNTISKIERGVDTKAKGGYVIWWPSEGHPVFDGDLLADIPEWLLDLVKPEERQERPAVAPRGTPDMSNPFHYLLHHRAQETVQRVLQRASDATPGNRQFTYWWCSQRLKEIVDEGYLDLRDAHDLLFEAALVSAEPGSEDGIRHAIRVLR